MAQRRSQTFFAVPPVVVVTLIIAPATVAFADSAESQLVKIVPDRARASSVLREKGRPGSHYGPQRAFDDKTSTAWCEGKKGPGIGEYLEATFDPTPARGVAILPGMGSSNGIYSRNNRIKGYRLTVTLRSGERLAADGSFEDGRCWINETHGKTKEQLQRMPCEVSYDGQIGAAVVDLNEMKGAGGKGKDYRAHDGAGCVKAVRLQIKSVYKGSKHDDTCVSRIALYDWEYEGETKLASELLGKSCR